MYDICKIFEITNLETIKKPNYSSLPITYGNYQLDDKEFIIDYTYAYKLVVSDKFMHFLERLVDIYLDINRYSLSSPFIKDNLRFDDINETLTFLIKHYEKSKLELKLQQRHPELLEIMEEYAKLKALIA